MKSLSRLCEKLLLAHTAADSAQRKENIPDFEKSVGVTAGDIGQGIERRHRIGVVCYTAVRKMGVVNQISPGGTRIAEKAKV